jgi:ABC-type dipeptide/oligopeptide/nickel transport system permease component
MGRRVVNKLISTIFSLFVVSIIVFSIRQLISEQLIREELVDFPDQAGLEQFRQRLGLDTPAHIQYLRWIGQVVSGELGRSIWTSRPVVTDLTRRLPLSLALSGITVAFILALSIPLGVWLNECKTRAGKALYQTIRFYGSLPVLWLAVLATMFIYPWLGWLATDDAGGVRINTTAIIVTTAFIMALSLLGVAVTRVRAIMGLLQVCEDKSPVLVIGLLLGTHIIGGMLPLLLSTQVLVELAFRTGGVSRFLLTALIQRDTPVISGTILVIVVFILAVKLILDLIRIYLGIHPVEQGALPIQ